MMRPYPFPAKAGIEPSLSEILADPILHLVLQRDGIAPADVIGTIRTWRLANNCILQTHDAA